MDGSVNIINWFEIPVSDLVRARKFYETVFGIQLQEGEMMGVKLAFFPAEDKSGKVSGCLAQSDVHIPSKDGTKVYFNGNPDLQTALSKVEAAGGKIMIPKEKINDEAGYMAFFIDSEGNEAAMHSQK